ncbi:MAG TPA: chemotaxis response regulator protein-glutamate methylesterase [Thermodesulfobacteriaceae bacterium]|nr:chemotaxis response regulator protein-glutamate methylesterase [Thermodesulfobacteriaceae bacterium]
MIKVLIVDDSVVFRKILTEAVGREPGVKVVGSAVNGREALRLIRDLRPHVMVLDVEMPEMDGLRTLDEIRRQHFDIGVIMFSMLTSKGASTTLEALAKGAFDFVPKPSGNGAFGKSVEAIKKELLPKIKAYAASSRRNIGLRPARLAAAKTRKYKPCTPVQPVGKHRRLKTVTKPVQRAGPRPVLKPGGTPAARYPRGLRPEAVVIGVSTGGPGALNEVIPVFPAGFRLPIFLVQHMPPVFTTHLAQRLDSKSRLRVVEARDRQPVRPGTVYVAPGDYHMTIRAERTSRVIHLSQEPPINSCRPAADLLFASAAKIYGGRTTGIIMTGMGQDGLKGSEALKSRGALIVAQDRDTCVVWGMPKAVTEAGLADRICPLDKIAHTVMELAGTAGMPSVRSKQA